MKIRTGFVSNSSSSSFIVAFPKKPSTVKDVELAMFNGNIDGGIHPYDFQDATPKSSVAEQVFEDITRTKRATKSQIISELSSRYFVMSGESSAYYPPSNYCSTDHPLMTQIINKEAELDAISERYDIRLAKMLENEVGPKIPYASKESINWTTKKPYTPDEISAYNKYCKQVEKFTKSNADYIKLTQEKWNEYRKEREKINKLADDLAEVDANKFLTDNRGKYVVILSYSDNDGAKGANMEHGDIFENLNYIRVSHH